MRAIPVKIKQGDTVMIQQPERKSKLSPKFVGPYKVVRYIYGNKFEVLEPNTIVTLVIHSDCLKLIPSPDSSLPENTKQTDRTQDSNNREHIKQPASHSYNLRPRN